MATYETIQSERRQSAKRRLEGYKAHCERHDQFLQQIEKADSRLMSITAQLGETVSSSSASDSLANGVVAIDELAGKLRKVDEEICEALDDVLALVEEVTELHPTAGRILSMRYLEPSNLTFVEIAEKTHYSEDHVIRLHQAGLDIAATLMARDNMTGNVG